MALQGPCERADSLNYYKSMSRIEDHEPCTAWLSKDPASERTVNALLLSTLRASGHSFKYQATLLLDTVPKILRHHACRSTVCDIHNSMALQDHEHRAVERAVS
eukprot:COSAG05_NODE_2685_length_2770_cov_24.723325_2_plen_104_part_00